MPKGSDFERRICKELSLWWTDGATDDVFWRTAGSGARAKTRAKTARDTFGQHGDIQATDPIGQPLIDVCSIELKCGYNRLSLQDLIDLPDPAKVPKPTKKTKNPRDESMAGFIRQAYGDHLNADSLFWMLIVHRDRRETLAIIPKALYIRLMTEGLSTFNLARPLMRIKSVSLQEGLTTSLIATTLDQFLLHVSPEDIRALK